ncbi:MAG: hypothetical protein WBA97_35450 [Actinophytocola sp.]
MIMFLLVGGVVAAESVTRLSTVDHEMFRHAAAQGRATRLNCAHACEGVW